MFDIKSALSKNKLLNGFNNQEITDFLISSKYKTRDYQAGQIIAIKGESLTKIGLILIGEVEIQKNYPAEKMIVINQIPVVDVF